MQDRLLNHFHLNGFQLKVLAIILMTIDHVGAVIFPQYKWMRIVGRLAFPIFAFLCVEGIIHTSNSNRYLLRLGVFALVSELPFDILFNRNLIYMGSQNIFFTLFIGVMCIDILRKDKYQSWKYIFVYCLSLSGDLLHTDYGTLGVWMIICLYIARDKLWKLLLVLVIINVVLDGDIQSYASFAIIPISLYDGTKGQSTKAFFYLYYPIHLLAIACIMYLL